MAKQYNRQFDWTKPIIIENKEFPTTVFPVEDNENNINQMRVGTNALGEYFTLFDDKIQPVMLQGYVPEVTATGSKEKFRKKVMEEARKNSYMKIIDLLFFKKKQECSESDWHNKGMIEICEKYCNYSAVVRMV